MDIKERLARLKERREGEEIADLAYDEYGDITPVDLAALIADTDPEECSAIIDSVGGLELYQEYRALTDAPLFDISTEEFRDKLAAILTRIIAFIKRWMREIVAADLRMSVSTAYYQTLVDNVRVNARSQNTQKKATHFVVNSRVANLSVNYRVLTDAVAIMNALTSLEKIVGLYFRTYIPKVMDNARSVITAGSTLTNANGLVQLMSQLNPHNTFKGEVFRAVGRQTESLHMMGNHKLVITNDGGLSSSLIDQLAGTRIKLEQSQLTPPTLPPSISIPHFDVSTINTITTKLTTILDHLALSNTGRYRSIRRHSLNELATTLERAKNSLVSDSSINEDRVKEVTTLLETFITWIADPYVGFYAYILRDVRAVINVCVENISQ